MKKFALVSILTLFAIPLIANAQGVDPVVAICNILQVVKIILLAVGLGIAVIGLIIGGIRYMTSAGDSQKADSGKKAIIGFLIGLIVVLAAGFILALVQGLLVRAGISMFSNPCGP
jgi:hypothetical protein